MPQKVIVVTGATSGIGRSATAQFLNKTQEDLKVVLACRNLEKGKRVLKEICNDESLSRAEIMKIDLSSQKSIRAFVKEFCSKYSRLDVLINNAAFFDISQKERKITEEGFELAWATNHLGPFLLTILLLQLLKQTPGSRVLNVSSKGLLLYPNLTIDFSDTNLDRLKAKFSVQRAYYVSKLAQIMFTYKLAEEIGKGPPTVNCIRVTNVAFSDARLNEYHITGCYRCMYSIKRKFAISPDDMAKIYIVLALSDKFSKVTGKHIDEKLKFVGSNRFSKKKEFWNDLWQISKSQTGLE